MRNLILFIHGAAYSALVFVSCFAYGMYTKQITAGQVQHVVLASSESEWISQIEGK
jgi:hypothetical protein